MSRNTTKIYISYKTQCQLKTNFDIIVVNNKLILFKKRKKSTTKTYLSLVTQLKTTTVSEIKKTNYSLQTNIPIFTTPCLSPMKPLSTHLFNILIVPSSNACSAEDWSFLSRTLYCLVVIL